MIVTSYVFNTQEGQDLYDLIHRSLRMKKAFNKEYLEKIVSFHGVYCMCVFACVCVCMGTCMCGCNSSRCSKNIIPADSYVVGFLCALRTDRISFIGYHG